MVQHIAKFIKVWYNMVQLVYVCPPSCYALKKGHVAHPNGGTVRSRPGLFESNGCWGGVR